MKPIHIKSKESKTISLLIVPHAKEISQVKIATWVPKLLLGLIITVILTSGYLTLNLYGSYRNLKENYNDKKQNLESLEALNQQQQFEIDNLRFKTAEVEEKLNSISDLQETVKNMVGITESSEILKNQVNADKDNNPSRSGGTSRNYKSPILNDNEFELHLLELSLELDKSSEELSILIDDVDKKLKYLDSKPNLMPTSGKIASGFGYRKNPFGRGKEFHSGLDIANSSGTKIMASGSGIVTFSGYNKGYGNYIIISHGYGYQSIYAHNRKLLVSVGDKVEKGQIISEMGSTGRSTGPHLHFEVKLNGKSIDPKTVINNMD